MPIERKRGRDGQVEIKRTRLHKQKVDKRGRKIVFRGHKDFTDKEVAFIKCLLGMGVTQPLIADIFCTYPKIISDIKLGRAWQHVVGFEVWSRDVTGGLHKRLDEEDFKKTWEDSYARYNGKPVEGEVDEGKEDKAD